MKNKSWFVVSSLLIISLSIAACTSNAPVAVPKSVPIATVQPTEAPMEPAVSFPTGKFIKSGEPNHALVFQKDGIFSVTEGSTTLVTGTYHVDNNTYTEESNNAGCSVPQSFKYSFDGKNLTFNYVGDPAKDTCGGGGRRADFDNVTYTLSK